MKIASHCFIALTLVFVINLENIFAQHQQLIQGQRLPRLTTEQRDQIPVNNHLYSSGLLIYNMDTDCIEYYNGEKWVSLCGQKLYSTLEVNCRDITYHGDYMQGVPLNNSNYLSMIVNVIDAGIYSFVANTDNGYGFYSAGIFLNSGIQHVTIAGQGTPKHESTDDTVHFVINGFDDIYSCTDNPVVISVMPSNSTFTMDCNSVIVNGVYIKGVSLKPSNTIALNVDVTALGNGHWNATTNTVDGIYFRGSGMFTTTGKQTIVLNGYGTPITANEKQMIISTNSASHLAKTCTTAVKCVNTAKSILVMGYSITFGGPDNSYGYNANINASYNMVRAQTNFGTLSNSTVQVEKLNISGVNAATANSGVVNLPSLISSNPNIGNLRTALAKKPDIVIIGWGMTYTNDMITEFINYLNQGGVMIIMNKFSNTGTATSTEANFFSTLFGTTVTAATIRNVSGGNITGATWTGGILRLASIPGDPILDGPFGNFNDSLWGNDYFPATFMSGIPESQIITYSGANLLGGSSSTGVTMFRHATLNLFWIGDGGFLSNNTASGNLSTYPTIMPFATNSSHQPVPRTNFGGGTNFGGSGQIVYNSQLFANILAWAIRQAENNGINSQ